jgi:hypothetical protein
MIKSKEPKNLGGDKIVNCLYFKFYNIILIFRYNASEATRFYQKKLETLYRRAWLEMLHVLRLSLGADACSKWYDTTTLRSKAQQADT